MILGIIDLAQIEARILAWVAGQDDLSQGFAEGKSPYSELATIVFDEKIWKPSDEEKKTPEGQVIAIKYGFGKDSILGQGYGMGSRTFYNNCLANPDLKPFFDSGEYTFAFIEKLTKIFRTKYSKIPALWANIEKAFRWVVKYPHEHKSIPFFEFWNDNGVVNIQLPSTRCLKYPEARIVKDRWNGKLKYKKYYLWGGAITENVVQAIARDIFVEGVLRLDAAGIPVILRSHDEVVMLLSEKNAEKKLEKAIDIFCYKPSWAQDLCIAGEGELTKFYKK